MPRRNLVLATDESYHIFNRSVGKEEIFSTKTYLNQALQIVNYYRFPQRIRLSQFKALNNELKKEYLLQLQKTSPLVEIYTFAFMPNHYHLQVKQLQDGGIVRFVSNFQNSFAKYFNLQNRRHGALFQNSFKAKRVETDEEFIHLARYIHLNPVTSYLIEFDQLANYPWTSFACYLGNQKNLFVSSQFLLNMFKTKRRLVKFTADQVDYQRKLAKIKNLIIE